MAVLGILMVLPMESSLTQVESGWLITRLPVVVLPKVDPVVAGEGASSVQLMVWKVRVHDWRLMPFRIFESVEPNASGKAHGFTPESEEETMQMVAELKTLLLEILESAFQNGDVYATQQMGVNMSNAVKREGGDYPESEA